MIVVGITGGIAVGKNAVSKVFQSSGIPIVDADQIARDVVEPGSYGLQAIVNMFGEDMLLPDGNLNRSKLGELVFSHSYIDFRKECLDKLNKLMLPLIAEEATKQFKNIKDVFHNCNLVGYNAPLIIESGNADKYRPLIVVYCSVEEQIRRLISRNGLTKRQAMDRINCRMSSEEKIAVADYTINTSGNVENSIKQTKVIIKELFGKTKSN